MTTLVRGSSIVFPDGTTQSTAIISPPFGTETVPGIYVLSNNTSSQDRTNNYNALKGQHVNRNNIVGVGGAGTEWINWTGAYAPGVTHVNSTGRGIMLVGYKYNSGTGANGTGFAYTNFKVNGSDVIRSGGYQGYMGGWTCSAVIVQPGGTFSFTAVDSLYALVFVT